MLDDHKITKGWKRIKKNLIVESVKLCKPLDVCGPQTDGDQNDKKF